MEITLNDLRTINDNLMKKNEDNNKYLLIEKLLKHDDVFFQINMDTALKILSDLGFDKQQSIIIYTELISQKKFKC